MTTMLGENAGNLRESWTRCSKTYNLFSANGPVTLKAELCLGIQKTGNGGRRPTPFLIDILMSIREKEADVLY